MRGYTPETRRVNTREVFLLVCPTVCSRRCSGHGTRRLRGGTAGDNVVLVLVVDELLVVVCAHFGGEVLLDGAARGGGREMS